MKILEVLQIAEIAISIILAVVVILQEGGGGLGVVFGGGGGESYRSKRGVEAFLYKLTIVLIVLFISNALAITIISSK